MSKVLYVVIIALSVLLGVTALVCGLHTDWLGRGVPLGAALIVVGLSVLGMRQPGAKYPAAVIAVLGLVLFVWAIAIACLLGTSGGWSGAIIGLLWLFLGCFITQLFVFPSGSAYDKSGNSLTTISNIRVKGDDIVVKAVLLGTMPSTIYMRPEEVWKLLPLIDAAVVGQLPRILYQGWKRARKLVKEQKSTS